MSTVSLHNTAFQDEALYLYAGRQIFHHWLGGPVPLDHYAFYFSGYPGVYPVIGGVLDMLGGLAAARAFSLACMLGVTTVVYLSSTRLFGRSAGVLAAATYGSVGAVMFVGRLATFDALCLFFVSAAVALAYRQGRARALPWTVAIGPLLVLAILAKYAALLFVAPVLSIVAIWARLSAGWWRMLLRIAGVLVAFGLSLLVAYQVVDKAAVHAIAGSTTNRVSIVREPRLQLFTHVLYMGGVVYLLALGGVALVIARHRQLTVMALTLFASSWLAPAYHIYKQEAISLDKHMAYAMFFAAPLAGYALAWISGQLEGPSRASHRAQWLAGIAIVLAILTLGVRQARVLYEWADTSQLRYALRTQLRDGAGRILAEDIEVARYDGRDFTEQWQWSGLLYLYYVTAHRRALLGDPAVARAIDDRYFAFVELSFNYHLAEADFAAEEMARTRNYDLIAVIPFKNSFGRGHFFLWRTALVPGHGNFTNVLQVKTREWYKTCITGICPGAA